MLKLTKFLLWLVVLMALIAGSDLLLTGAPLQTPGLRESQRFYVDFRARLLRLFWKEGPSATDSIGKVIEATTPEKVAEQPKNGRYLYVDGNGDLQFADSYQQVPAPFRKNAQPLAE